MWPLVVVDGGEAVELLLELVDAGRWWLGSEPLFECLLESFDFADGGGMVGPAVLWVMPRWASSFSNPLRPPFPVA